MRPYMTNGRACFKCRRRARTLEACMARGMNSFPPSLATQSPVSKRGSLDWTAVNGIQGDHHHGDSVQAVAHDWVNVTMSSE